MPKKIHKKADVIQILKELSDGEERRFTQLLNVGIPRTNLAKRLKELEVEGYISRRLERGIPPKTFYRITDKGLQLYKELLKVKVSPFIDDYAKHFTEEVLATVRKYMKVEDKR